MPRQRAALRRGALRAADWIGRVLVVVAAAGALVRWLNTSAAGIGLMDQIPSSLWDRYHRLFGLDKVGFVEQVQDADAIPVFLVCVGVSAGVLASLEALWRRHVRSVRRAT